MKEQTPAERLTPARALAFADASNQIWGWADRSWRLGLNLLLRPVYRLYEKRLADAVRQGCIPRHIGIILDGNRRYGRAHGVTDFRRLYDIGAGKLDGVLDWCAGIGVPAVTRWVCSADNLARPHQEVSGILGAIETKVRALAADPRVHRLGVRVQAIGRLDLLPENLVSALEAASRAPAGNKQITLTIAAGYGGRGEIAW